MGKRTSDGALDVIDQVKASLYLREGGKHEKGREGGKEGKEGKEGGEERLYVNTYSCWRACQLARWISEILAASALYAFEQDLGWHVVIAGSQLSALRLCTQVKFDAVEKSVVFACWS